MIKANDITRKSWINYNESSDFPIQNIPFGLFKSIDNNKMNIIHAGTIIGNTIISLSKLEELGYFKKTSLNQNTFKSDNLNLFIRQGKKIWREIRDEIAILFDVNNKKIQNNDAHKNLVLFELNAVELLKPIHINLRHPQRR